MIAGGTAKGRVKWRWSALAGATAVLIAATLAPAQAQMFTDRPPPIPPASVPEPGNAINLAPPSDPASLSSLPAPLTQPPVSTAVPPAAAPPIDSTPGQAVLSLTARYGKDLPVINSGLVWRVYSDRPDET